MLIDPPRPAARRRICQVLIVSRGVWRGRTTERNMPCVGLWCAQRLGYWFFAAQENYTDGICLLTPSLASKQRWRPMENQLNPSKNDRYIKLSAATFWKKISPVFLSAAFSFCEEDEATKNNKTNQKRRKGFLFSRKKLTTDTRGKLKDQCLLMNVKLFYTNL